MENPGPTVPTSFTFWDWTAAPSVAPRSAAAASARANTRETRHHVTLRIETPDKFCLGVGTPFTADDLVARRRAIIVEDVLRLGLCVEAVGQRGHDPGACLCRFVVRERALGRLERQMDGYGLSSLTDLLAAMTSNTRASRSKAPAASCAASTRAPTSTSSATATAMSWSTAGNVSTSS